MADHSFTLINRTNMQLTGIKNVNTFDEDEIILETELGFLFILGQDLHVSMLNLEQGKVALEGTVNSIEYKAQADIKAKGRNILNRLLK
ncbi:MAG: sporulation protein YabP [Syntrophomonadaceae bacterium]|jgi:sporulation protein YabP